MILLSQSGYAMPFEDKEADVTPSLAFGKQKHPKTGETFFHHGCDFAAKRGLLSAVADGQVKDMGVEPTHGQSSYSNMASTKSPMPISPRSMPVSATPSRQAMW